MEISNFRDYSRTGTSCLNWVYKATVDVTTGKLWWKRTRSVAVHRDYAGGWFFVDSGEFTPGYDVENLERSYRAANGVAREF